MHAQNSVSNVASSAYPDDSRAAVELVAEPLSIVPVLAVVCVVAAAAAEPVEHAAFAVASDVMPVAVTIVAADH